MDQDKADYELLTRRSSTSTTTSSDASQDKNVWPLHLTPNFIRHYIIGEVIGSGSYADVRECVDTTTLERLALKIVNRDYLRRRAPRALANQMQEIKLLRRLHHQNIIAMRECLSIGSYIYIALEYCSFNLDNFLNEQPQSRLDSTICRDFFHQICSGVCYLHSVGIVHRDIKPQNMLLTNNGILKLIDFGVSQILSIWNVKATCTNYEGSPLFQAPEVVDGSAEYDGYKVDVWSCGITLYRMLYGEYPFMDEALLGLYDKILGQQYTIPKEFQSPRILKDLIAILLEKDHRRRACIDEVLAHPWLKLHHAAGPIDDGDEDSEFLDFVASKQDFEGSLFEKTGTDKNTKSDIYKSMSVLPYLYRYHFIKSHASKQNSTEFLSASEDSTKEQSRTHNSTQATPDDTDDQDERVEWGTKEQYDLMKVPQVRANRLKAKPDSRF